MKRCLLVLAFLLLFVGCHRVTPVAEVSVESSGVELQDVEPSLTVEADWASWRGPTGNGVAIEQDAPTKWSAGQGIAWQSDVPGRGHSSPIVVRGQVMLATARDAEEQQLVVAFDAETGDKRWETVVHEGGFPSKSEVHQKATNANGTVASDGKHAFISFFNSGKIFATALDLEGQIVWHEELGGFRSKFGFAPSPVLYKSFVIFAAEHMSGGYISALDTETGKLAWRIARPAENSHSTPALIELDGKTQLLISGCNAITSYDPATGQENWQSDYSSGTTCGTMVSSGGRVYASGGYPNKQTVCLSSSGQKLWENRVKVYEPSMLAVGDALYAVSDDGIAYCWDANDGSELWRKRLGGSFSASPTLCGDNIYVSDLAGNTYVYKASKDAYELVAKNQLGSDCYASPAIVGGKIYLRIGLGSGRDRREQLVCIVGADAS